LLLETARIIRETVLAQSAFDPNDAFSSVDKTYQLAALAQQLFTRSIGLLEAGTAIERLELAPARQALASARRAPVAEFDARVADVSSAIEQLAGGRGAGS
jgi:vacuolar-type H+-ATPase catalytic subunit A/Vma1